MSKLGEEQTETVLLAVQSKIAAFPFDYPPIKMAMEIHDLVRSESGVGDPYAEIKKMSNDVCRECDALLGETMARSLNPLRTATQLAIAGNIIDCGAYGLRKVTKRQLFDVVQEVLSQPLKGSSVSDFDRLISSAESILYIGDNAGECFFDRPLLGVIPAGKVTYAVRGGPVLNDATVEDAAAADIHSICPVIDTGDNAPGILLERCSNEFKRAFEDSDLIISKGQGNYESLSEITGKTVVFLTKVKCEVIAKDIGYPLGSNVLKIQSKPNLLSHKAMEDNREVHHA